MRKFLCAFSASPNHLLFYPRRATHKEARNTFPLPEIIFNPSPILSPHIALLDLIFANKVFLAPNLMSAEKISELDIRPGRQQLPLRLKPEKANMLPGLALRSVHEQISQFG